MNFYAGRFNLYLLMLLALALVCDCASSKPKKDKTLGAMRVHIESTANLPDGGQTVSILRADPVVVTISKLPMLTEADIMKAALVESPGGFSVEVKFDEVGTLTLEQFSAAYAGKHFVIFGQWGEKLKDGRWLAAPIITGRIADGILAFTPDMTREEAQKLVLGLNNYAKKNKTGQ
jgi:preprotein translocase subunit SecD